MLQLQLNQLTLCGKTNTLKESIDKDFEKSLVLSPRKNYALKKFHLRNFLLLLSPCYLFIGFNFFSTIFLFCLLSAHHLLLSPFSINHLFLFFYLFLFVLVVSSCYYFVLPSPLFLSPTSCLHIFQSIVFL